MKSKKSRIYGIVGLALIVLAVCLVIFRKDDAGQIQKTQTKHERVTEVVQLQQESASETQKEFVYELEPNPTFPE